MIKSIDVKELAVKSGAALCGIANIDRFADAPEGFHPADIYKDTKSVIVFACRVSEGTLIAKNPIPYTVMEGIVQSKLNEIALTLSLALEDAGSMAVMIPSTPYDYWDEENLEGRGILSLKHLGYYAGLGVIGRNSLLCNSKYGNLIKLGAIVTDAVLEADDLQKEEINCEICNLCVESCPVGAITENVVSQKKCRPHSEIINKRGVEIYSCSICRKICPNRSGIK